MTDSGETLNPKERRVMTEERAEVNDNAKPKITESELADFPRRLSDFEIPEMPSLADDNAMLVGDNNKLRAELRRLEEEIKEWNVAFKVWDGTLALHSRRIAELEQCIRLKNRDVMLSCEQSRWNGEVKRLN